MPDVVADERRRVSIPKPDLFDAFVVLGLCGVAAGGELIGLGIGIMGAGAAVFLLGALGPRRR